MGLIDFSQLDELLASQGGRKVPVKLGPATAPVIGPKQASPFDKYAGTIRKPTAQESAGLTVKRLLDLFNVGARETAQTSLGNIVEPITKTLLGTGYKPPTSAFQGTPYTKPAVAPPEGVGEKVAVGLGSAASFIPIALTAGRLVPGAGIPQALGTGALLGTVEQADTVADFFENIAKSTITFGAFGLAGKVPTKVGKFAAQTAVFPASSAIEGGDASDIVASTLVGAALSGAGVFSKTKTGERAIDPNELSRVADNSVLNEVKPTKGKAKPKVTPVEKTLIDDVKSGQFAREQLKTQKPAVVLRPTSTGRVEIVKGKEVVEAYRQAGERMPGWLVGSEAIKTAKSGAQTKTRGFVESVQESTKTAPQVKAGVAGEYVPKPNDILSTEARNLINKDFDRAKLIATTEPSDRGVATAMELIAYYQKAGDYTSAVEIANNLAPRLTELGRAVQAASLYGKISPEGIVKYAAGEIIRAKQTNPNVPDLTPEQAKQLVSKAKQIQKMSEGRDKNLAIQKLMESVQDLVPSPTLKRVVSIWKAGLLTGLQTTGVNIGSNISHLVSLIAADIPAVGVDSILSLLTGKRTKALTLQGLKGGMKEGIKRGFDYLKTGYDERHVGAKLDYKRVNFGKSPFAKSLQAYEEGVFRFIGSQDQPFYYGAKARSLYDQAIAQGKTNGLKGADLQKFVNEKVKNPTDEMVAIASNDASVAVFQNQTALGDIAKHIQRSVSGGGELVVPFGRTPAAVATQMLSFSPIGIFKTAAENIGKGRFNQRAFSEGIGRGLTGTAALALGAYLYKKGLVSTTPKDDRERAAWDAQRRSWNSIKVGGSWQSVAPMGPLGMMLVVGAIVQQGYEEKGSPTEAITMIPIAIGSILTEQTFLQGTSRLIEAVKDPARYFSTWLQSTAGSVIPAGIAAIARAIDPLQREVNAPVEAIMNRVPVLRQSLLPKRNIFGQAIERASSPVSQLINPFRSSAEVRDEVLNEMLRLNKVGYQDVVPTRLQKTQTVAGQRIKLKPTELDELEQKLGIGVYKVLNNLMFNADYALLKDEDKAKAIKMVVDTIRNQKGKLIVGQTSEEQMDFIIKNLPRDQKSQPDFLTKLVKGGLVSGEALSRIGQK